MTETYTMKQFLNMDVNLNDDVEEIDYEIITEEEYIENIFFELPKVIETIIMDYKYEMEHKEKMNVVLNDLKNYVERRNMFVSYDLEYESMGENTLWSDFNYVNVIQNSFIRGITNVYMENGELNEIETKEEFWEKQDEFFIQKLREGEEYIEDDYRIWEFNNIQLFYKNGDYESLGDYMGKFVQDYYIL